MHTRNNKRSKPEPSAAPQQTDPAVDPHVGQDRAISTPPSTTTPQQFTTPGHRAGKASNRPSASPAAALTPATPRNGDRCNSAAPASSLATSSVNQPAASASSSPSTAADQVTTAIHPSPGAGDIDAPPSTPLSSQSPPSQGGESAWEDSAAPDPRGSPGPPDSPGSDASTIPDETCEHSLHPAYSTSYHFPLCPSCRLNACIQAVQVTNSMLMAHGGSNQWIEYIYRELRGEQGKAELRESYFWRGKKAPRSNGRRGDGSLSYPSSRTRLRNLVAELEGWRDEEEEWEKRHPVQLMDCTVYRQWSEARQTCAANTLQRSTAVIKNSGIYRVEHASSTFSRKRGRELQIAAQDGFPGPHDLFAVGTSLTAEQELFIEEALGPDDQLHEYDPDAVPPKRKRRRRSASVEFHPLVYVRAEADIDSICGPTAPWRDIAHQPVPARASRGILLTAPGHMDPTPRRAHTVQALEWEDKHTAKRGMTKGAVRWKPSPGSERVNTSGCKYGEDDSGWMQWAIYVSSFDESPVETGIQTATLSSHDDAPGEHAGQERSADDGLDDHEVPSDAELAEAQRQIECSVRLQDVERAEMRVQPVVPRAQQVVARARRVLARDPRGPERSSSPPRRPSCSPSQQIHAELGDQGREAEAAATRAQFRPHGGMASAFAFGDFVSGKAVGIARRYGIL